MQISNNRVTLRDIRESDIENRIRWETVETEWQLWDGPWETEGLTREQRDEELVKYIDRLHERVVKAAALDDEQMRYCFEIDMNGPEPKYVGFCSAYTVNDDLLPDKNGSHIAVGIDVPDMAARHRGIAASALMLFIEYLRSHGVEDIYTQTWSGNLRMIGLAERLGFTECLRRVGLRRVRGEAYDGLTFKLDNQKYAEFKAEYEATETEIKKAADALNMLGIPFVLLRHHAASTIELCKGIGEEYGAEHCKNLFLTNRQGNRFCLVLFDSESSFRTADFSKKLGIPRQSFATAEQLYEHLGIRQGSVSVLSLIHESARRLYDDGRLIIAVDSRLLSRKNICIHPNSNRATFVARTSDVLRMLSSLGYEYHIIRYDG